MCSHNKPFLNSCAMMAKVAGSYINRGLVKSIQTDGSELIVYNSQMLVFNNDGTIILTQASRLNGNTPTDPAAQLQTSYGAWKINSTGEIRVVMYDYFVYDVSNNWGNDQLSPEVPPGEYDRYASVYQLQSNGEILPTGTRLVNISDKTDPLSVDVSALTFVLQVQDPKTLYPFKRITVEDKYFGPVTFDGTTYPSLI